VWRWLFDWLTGVVNWLLVRVGFDGYAGHSWLAQPLSFFFVATVIIVWMSVSFAVLSLYAGLTQAPPEVLEAARIDGASGRQSLRHILLPMVRPVLAIVLLLQIIWGLRVFAQIHLLQDSGAPVSETNLPSHATLTNVTSVISGPSFGTALRTSLAVTGLTVLGVSVLYTATIVPFTVWMLRGFLAGVPAELEEAAMVDGLSRFQALYRITPPLLAPGLLAPGLLASGVYVFLQAWNEFTVALVVLPAESAQTLPLWPRSFLATSINRAESAQTLPLWPRSFLATSINRGVSWAEVMAASTLLAVPVIVFFLIVQNRMTSGLVSGAVKG